jgi:beta-galactosidase GanA
MWPLVLITALLGWISSVVSTDNGLTDLVSWDKYSLSVNGERVFINSAEFHYQRLPVPELWLDIFHRLKANGFNTVSIYFFWSYHSASKGAFDFETPGKHVQRLFDYAKEAGLWVVARAGVSRDPYPSSPIPYLTKTQGVTHHSSLT